MPIRVLIADNHPLLRRAVRELLASTPEIEVVGEAEDFSQTGRMKKELQPDVVLMDLYLPGMNPRDIKSEFRGSVLLAMSFANDPESQELAESLNPAALLDKTQLQEQLIPAILKKHLPI